MSTSPDLAAIGFVIALLTPVVNVVASAAKQNHFPKQVNALLALGISALGGVIVEIATGGFAGLPDPANWASIAALCYTASQLVYHSIFKDSQLDTVLADWPSRPQAEPPAPPAPPLIARKQGQ